MRLAQIAIVGIFSSETDFHENSNDLYNICDKSHENLNIFNGIGNSNATM